MLSRLLAWPKGCTPQGGEELGEELPTATWCLEAHDIESMAAHKHMCAYVRVHVCMCVCPMSMPMG